MSNSDGTNGFELVGISSSDRSGYSAKGTGDINNDGINDIIIGTDGADPDRRSRAGASYVVFRTTQGFSSSINFSELNGANGFVINGVDSADQAGYSVDGTTSNDTISLLAGDDLLFL